MDNENEFTRKQKIIVVLGALGIIILGCLVARLLFPLIKVTNSPPPPTSTASPLVSTNTLPVQKTRFPSPTPLPLLPSYPPLDEIRPTLENNFLTLQKNFLALDEDHTLIENQNWCADAEAILKITIDNNQKLLALQDYPPELALKITRLQTRSEKITPILNSYQELLTTKNLALMTEIKKQFLAVY